MNQPNYVTIRTCNRPAYLQRLLLSLSRRRNASPACVLVFDDSRDRATRRRNQQIVESAQRRFNGNSADDCVFSARYLGIQWQQDFIATLTGRFPADADSIHWLLAPRPPGIFSGGRLLNIIMLALAGHRFTLFDDDYLLDRARHLGQGYDRELSWSRNPARTLLVHASVRESRKAGQELEHDPIDAHLEFLGLRLRDCFQKASGKTESLLDASRAGPAPDNLNLEQDSYILTTVSGQYGAPISPNFFYLFYQPHGEAGPPWADPETYRLLRRGRAIWSLTHGPVITGRTGSTPGGVDNRHLMPPTLPHGKGEDTLFCIMVKFTHAKAAHLYLPWAIEHSRKSPAWANATFNERPRITLSRAIWKNSEELGGRVNRTGSGEDRLESLAKYWLDWSARDTAAIKAELTDALRRNVRWRIKVMSQCLSEVPDSRSQAHRDLLRGVQQFQSFLDAGDRPPEVEEVPGHRGSSSGIEALTAVGREFGLALAVWSRLWHTARDLQVLT